MQTWLVSGSVFLSTTIEPRLSYDADTTRTPSCMFYRCWQVRRRKPPVSRGSGSGGPRHRSWVRRNCMPPREARHRQVSPSVFPLCCSVVRTIITENTFVGYILVSVTVCVLCVLFALKTFAIQQLGVRQEAAILNIRSLISSREELCFFFLFCSKTNGAHINLESQPGNL